ncbi:isocitrate lyase/phosphoenolpyruvate mutase family protein [Streptomyces pactum]|uniref:Isocitrate lyase/phosphoenolpyruvate mutase family protein n=1 Tax=Streptomyces pactum TaxID=68249 RepID=A0ABS0NDX7_9ACTN|nr:isocitrate lyase/phosphoenolpyruvate mutase family protein [Streptomyces pactum]MBH5333405.1 isocitrate lyase/phosphoenolpyruvate mutase family protein [Streptomyces pactum]
MLSTQPDKATLFRSLHTPAAPLALANAWDVASARVIEAAGAPAIATTSAGVAWSLGSPDGDALTRERALDLISRISAAVTVPVTADIEGGYGQSADEVAETVAGVIAAGAVGVNIEDGTRPAEELAARLTAARRAADRAGCRLFLNARVDTYLFGLGDPETRLDQTLDRARRYIDAGADGIFVPGVTDSATVAALADGISVPLNVMAGPGAPTVTELGALGAARVSLGSGVAQAAYAAARRAVRELLTAGDYGSLADGIAFPELNGLLAAPRGAEAR